MNDETEDQVLKMIWTAGVECGKRQNDQVHDVLNGHTEEEAADDPIHFEERELAAGAVVDACCGGGDEVVKDQPEKIHSCAAVDGLLAEETGGNNLGNTPAEEN